MTDKQIPPDWVLLEAAKRCHFNMDVWNAYELREYLKDCRVFSALCDMIEKYEQPPVDRKVLCAREALSHGSPTLADEITDRELYHCVRAIELWEEGFGK